MKNLNLFIATILLLLSNFVTGQVQFIDTSFFLLLDSTTCYYSVNDSTEQNKDTVIAKLKNMYGIPDNDSYSLISADTDMNGGIHYRYQHYHGGIFVENSKITLHCTSDGVVQTAGGSFISSFDPDVHVSISPQTAIENAIAASAEIEKFLWENESYENALKEETGDANASYYPVPSLVYRADPGGTSYIPVYDVVVRSDTPTTGEHIFIRANDGIVIDRRSTLRSCGANHGGQEHSKCNLVKTPGHSPLNSHKMPSCSGECFAGNGATTIYGTQSINIGKKLFTGMTFNDCKFRLKENCNGQIVHTMSDVLISTNSGTGPFEFTDQNSTFSFAGTKPGIQVHWGLEQTLAYFQTQHNWLSMNNNQNGIIARIDQSVTNPASFDDNNFEVRFGAASSLFNFPPQSIDIVAHEFVHGISRSRVNFNLIGEPGALDEGFSDIFGKMVEFFAKNNNTTGTNFSYVVGEDVANNVTVVLPNSNISTNVKRDMSNPLNTLQPRFKNGTNWINTSLVNVDEGGKHVNNMVLGHWFFLLAEGGTDNYGTPTDFCVKGLGKAKAAQIAFHCLTNFISSSGCDFNCARASAIAAAANLFGANSNEVAQVTEAWYAVGVGPKYTGQILINNRNISGQENHNFNRSIRLQNIVVQSTGDVDFSSNTSVQAVPLNSYLSGSNVRLFIAPTCNGNGARVYQESETGSDVGITENNLLEGISDKVKIIPNPSNGVFVVEVESESALQNVTVLDIMGREVSAKVSPENKLQFDLQNMPNGIYLLKITLENKTFTQRIIKE